MLPEAVNMTAAEREKKELFSTCNIIFPFLQPYCRMPVVQPYTDVSRVIAG